jgi:hypothetical protein
VLGLLGISVFIPNYFWVDSFVHKKRKKEERRKKKEERRKKKEERRKKKEEERSKGTTSRVSRVRCAIPITSQVGSFLFVFQALVSPLVFWPVVGPFCFVFFFWLLSALWPVVGPFSVFGPSRPCFSKPSMLPPANLWLLW